MYKLVVIDGPNRGTSYPVLDGENSLGRSPENTIVLASTKISKRHCVLIASSQGLLIRDEGSSNGTFVNGILTKTKRVQKGDRISIGEYVLELTELHGRVQKAAPTVGGIGRQLKFRDPFLPGASSSGMPMGGFPGGGMGGIPGAHGGMPSGGIASPVHSNQPPQDLKGKLIWSFEHRLMPVFYGMSAKHEWKSICIGIFSVFILGNLVISVSPLLESNRRNIVKESGRRAKFMARQIAEQNAPHLAAHMETKTDIGLIENAEGVRVAVLMDLDSRIIAPGSKLNQYLTSGVEGSVAVRGREWFQSGHETGFVLEPDDSSIVAIEPVKVLNPAAGRNQIIAMALVSLDTSLSTPEGGEMGMIYSETLILTGLLGAVLLAILYRLTLKPLETLNEDMDKALKGEISQVRHEFKFEELNSLWEIINSAIQRIPKGGGAAVEGLGDSDGIDAFAGPLRKISEIVTFGFVVFDSGKNIIHLNSPFEEISGIRLDQAIGKSMTDVARDESMASFTNDILDRVPVGGEGISEDYDFSGISYKVHVSAFGTLGQSAKCYTMSVVKTA